VTHCFAVFVVVVIDFYVVMCFDGFYGLSSLHYFLEL